MLAESVRPPRRRPLYAPIVPRAGFHIDDVMGAIASAAHWLAPPPAENTVADLAAYETRTLAELFPAPAQVPVVNVKRRWRALGVESDLAWFPSLHEPLEPRFARRYRRYRANHTVWTRWIRPASGAGRPRLVYLHGFMQPETPLEELSLLTALASQLRVEVVQVQPPYHGRRKPRGSRFDGELFFTADDHFFRPARVEAMWRRWGEPPIHWYSCSHMGFLPHLPDAIARLAALVEQVDRETRAATGS
jgi:hypothetical protein